MSATTQTTNTPATQAELIGVCFDSDGQCWTSVDDLDLDDVCEARAGRPTYRDGHGTDTYRYDFDDGSSIIVSGSGWDYGLPGGCYCQVGNGHTEDCIACEGV